MSRRLGHAKHVKALGPHMYAARVGNIRCARGLEVSGLPSPSLGAVCKI